MLKDNDNLPEWVQSKITLAEDYISTVANYMASEIDEEVVVEGSEQQWRVTVGTKTGGTSHTMTFGGSKQQAIKQAVARFGTSKNPVVTAIQVKEEVEQLEEGRPSQRHPLEGHEYHKKSDAELEYIAKDAHKAAEAMKSHNTTAENKYRDQANDSATVRYFRKKNGMPEWYKKKYGHVNESADVPFDPPYKKSTGVVTDKSGAKHGPMSQARNLARQAMKDVGDKQKKSLKSSKAFSESKKAEIVKDVIKGKKTKDKFEAEPIISSSPDSKGTIDN
jgi:hypothetical protein